MQRFDGGHYPTVDEFKRDFDLMANNCKEYCSSMCACLSVWRTCPCLTRDAGKAVHSLIWCP